MIDEETQLANISLLKQSTGMDSLSLLSGVRVTTDMVKAFNNVTFIYDPNWEYEAGNPTYPLAFFYIKSITESMNSDISTKPMLFYNSASDQNDGVPAGLLNIVADNIVIKPKLYKLDILIPANSTTFTNTSLPMESIITSVTSYISKDVPLESVLRNTNIIIRALLKGLYGTSLSVTSICNMLLQQQDFNKASIEYMWRNRRIIGLKNWNSWKFKYLVIQNFEVTKVGENGSFYEGSLVCQEVPILTFRNQEKTSLGFMSTISSFLGQAQKAVAKTFVNAMTASLGE